MTRAYSGLTTVTTDESGNQRTALQDQLLQTTLVSELAEANHPVETKYAYGPFGVPELITDAAGNKTSASFDKSFVSLGA